MLHLILLLSQLQFLLLQLFYLLLVVVQPLYQPPPTCCSDSILEEIAKCSFSLEGPNLNLEFMI